MLAVLRPDRVCRGIFWLTHLYIFTFVVAFTPRCDYYHDWRASGNSNIQCVSIYARSLVGVKTNGGPFVKTVRQELAKTKKVEA